MAVGLPADAREREHHGPEVHRASRGSRGRTTTRSFWRFLAERLNEAGALAKADGLQFFYHNHNFEFENKQADGTPFYDILLEETDPDLVKFELDLYWIIHGGREPARVPARTRDRYFAYHVKDRTWRRPAGRGGLRGRRAGRDRLPGHLRRGRPPRTDKHYFVEHDSPWLSHPDDPEAEFKTARTGRDLPAQRALLASRDRPGPPLQVGLIVPGGQAPARRSPSRPSGGRGARTR